MISKILPCFLLCALCFISNGQPIRPFKDQVFDTSYMIISIASRTTTTDGRSPYNFYVNNIAELNAIKKTWKLKDFHPKLQMEDSSVSIYVVKGKELMEVPLLIFPQQGIANYKNMWYDFDMEKLLAVAQKHPLKCRSQYFSFEMYTEYIFFEDSIQTDPNFLFLFKPTAHTYPGYFDLFVKKEASSAPEVNALEAINKEIPIRFSNEKFHATVSVKDTTNGTKADEVRIRIECSETLYQKYRHADTRKSPWTVFPFDTRVYFKD